MIKRYIPITIVFIACFVATFIIFPTNNSKSGVRNDTNVLQKPYVTPTPFQPMRVTPTPFQPVYELVSLEVPIIEESLVPEIYFLENVYLVGDINLGEQETVTLTIYLDSGESVTSSFIPIIPLNGPSDYPQGSGKAGVYADDWGNITINPHSGCFFTGTEYIDLESEGLRTKLEGGNCYDINFEFSQEQIDAQIASFKNSKVVLSQFGQEVSLKLLDVTLIEFEEMFKTESSDPKLLMSLTQVSYESDTRYIVLITSGWNTRYETWYSAERWILVFKINKE